MNRVHLATCDRALPPAGPVPEWVHLLPAGRIVARDGREFRLDDPGPVLRAFAAGKIDLPIDFEHQNDKPEARLHGPVKAAGWIRELRFEDGSGLWGRVEWTATAAELIAAREYRYLSPSLVFEPKSGAVQKLKGAGLVHHPALHLEALAEEDTAMPLKIDRKPPPGTPRQTVPDPVEGFDLAAVLAELLGLDPGLPPQELAAELARRLKAEPDPRHYAPTAALAEVMSHRSAELAELRQAQAVAKVDAAFKAGYISPAMRPWATALCTSDETAFDEFCEKSGPVFAALMRPTHATDDYDASRRRTPRGDDNEIAAAVCEQLGLAPGTLNA